MAETRTEVLPIQGEADVVMARQAVRRWAAELRFGLVDQTKLVTAASELARNTLVYGGGGRLRIEAVENGIRRGLRLTFEDDGPGIADVQKALEDGYTTGGGLGMGLGGSRRLVEDFSIDSRPGEGTRVTVARWK
jgi:serine/threonine-protein kinase RsbT